jgi:hypothetical protein
MLLVLAVAVPLSQCTDVDQQNAQVHLLSTRQCCKACLIPSFVYAVLLGLVFRFLLLDCS